MEQKEILIFCFDVKRGLLSVLKVGKTTHGKTTQTLQRSGKVSQLFTRTYLKVFVCTNPKNLDLPCAENSASASTPKEPNCRQSQASRKHTTRPSARDN